MSHQDGGGVSRGDLTLRAALPDDVDALVAALDDAVNWTGSARVPRERLLADPALAHYVAGWPRPGDFGTVAVEGRTVVGAAWCRLFAPEDPGYGFVAADVPELSMAVRVDRRGQGIGSALVAAAVAQARARGLRALSLSVEDGNPARTLYERAGFVAVARNGGSDTMVLRLAGPSDGGSLRLPSPRGTAAGTGTAASSAGG